MTEGSSSFSGSRSNRRSGTTSVWPGATVYFTASAITFPSVCFCMTKTACFDTRTAGTYSPGGMSRNEYSPFTSVVVWPTCFKHPTPIIASRQSSTTAPPTGPPFESCSTTPSKVDFPGRGAGDVLRLEQFEKTKAARSKQPETMGRTLFIVKRPPSQ